MREVEVNLLGDGDKNIKMNAHGEGSWTDGSGNPILSLDGCFEVDISATLFTNTLAKNSTLQNNRTLLLVK